MGALLGVVLLAGAAAPAPFVSPLTFRGTPIRSTVDIYRVQ